MATYSREKILEMRKDGRITAAQARAMMVEARDKKPKPEPKPEDPLKVLASEMKAISEAIGDAAKRQEIPVAGTEEKRSKVWHVVFTRDNRGLIQSPIKLEAK